MYNRMQEAGLINQALDSLPVATELKLTGWQPGPFDSSEEIKGWKCIKVESQELGVHYVNCPTTDYKVVQHKDAFRPIIEGLTLSGHSDFKFTSWATPDKACLQVFVAGEGYETVSVGFSVYNSFDGRSALHYGFRAEQRTSWIELVGYRQICSNGMKIRVPLNEAEIIKPELMTKVKQLFEKHARILHTGKDVEAKVEAMQYVTEAISLLRAPVEALIKRAEKFTFKDMQLVEDLIKAHVKKRFGSKVLAQYNQDAGSSMWDLYNAITYVASHDADITVNQAETLKDRAADLLLLKVEVVQ